MRTWRLLLLSMFFFCFANIAAPPVVGADVYQGTVLDQETSEPLADAVLVVIWWTSPYVRMDGPRYFHDAKETLTDANGKFSLDITPKSNWNPFYFIESRPTTIIYKPGYRPLTGSTASSMGFRTSTDLAEALRRGVVVELPKLKPKDDVRMYLDPISLDANVPLESIPNLVRLINLQSKMVGVPGYPEPQKGGNIR